MAASIASTLAALPSLPSDTPRLDAELLLAHVLDVSRSYLHAWPERELTLEQQSLFHALLQRRQGGEPIAYLLGAKEFWSLPLSVSPATLIPRPETELIVETCLDKLSSREATVVDLGTGSGAIALALASARPGWHVHAVDNGADALAVAKANAVKLELAVQFYQGDWLAALPEALQFDAIVTNPPYVEADSPYLLQGDVRFEPRQALVSADNGLADIEHIIQGAPAKLRPNGWIIIEHGCEQGRAVCALLDQHGLQNATVLQDLAGLDRVSIAKLGV